MSDIKKKSVVINNKEGFHARPASEFAKLALSFQSEVQLVKESERIDGKSILDILTLGATQGSEIAIETCGPDSEEALSTLVNFVDSGFQAN